MVGIVNQQATVDTIERLLVNAAESLVAGLDSAFAQKISSSEYSWPRTTKRRNGQTVRTPRDIIDTGALDSSQRLSRPNRAEWQWQWDVPYAVLVHEGATLQSGAEYPARPWTKRAVDDYKPLRKFAQEIKRRG